MLQAEKCIYEGKLESDPESQVTLNGCMDEENEGGEEEENAEDEEEDGEDAEGMLLTIVSDKNPFLSSSYR